MANADRRQRGSIRHPRSLFVLHIPVRVRGLSSTATKQTLRIAEYL